MPRLEQKRSVRVAERVRAEVMELLLRGAVRDPRVKDVLVSEVRVTDDLGHARVYVRTLQPADAKQRAAVVKGLEHAAGYIRREVGAKLGLRYTPAFQFFWDEVVDSALQIESVLAEIRADAQEEERAREDSGDEAAPAGEDGA
ncbi:MAG: 30S ribosome-binding factor RbfA [Sandaracinaceae bacterium]|nr:30S ribosome-binding factor RbfA [Sandaracinaceae bacterium]